MSQLDIDDRINDLKRRIEVIEQLVGVSSMPTADQEQLTTKAVMDALVHVKLMKDQAVTKNKSIDLYMKDHSRPG